VWFILGIVFFTGLIFALLGKYLPGKVIAPFGLLLGILYAAWIGDGLDDVILIGASIVIVLAGLFLGQWGAIAAGSFLGIGMAAIGLVEINGTENTVDSLLTTYGEIAMVFISMILIAFVLSILISRLKWDLKDAQTNENLQALTNQELQASLEAVEQSVDQRTRQLSRRAQQLQAAAEVSRAVASIRDLNEILDRVTRQISEQFGYYHVGVFLLDSAGENAELRASNSTGGHRMLARKHSLPVGSKSIVGYTTGQTQARVALDVGQEAVYFDNPDLPETRSEMALPLIAGGKLLGALDIQSTEEGAFTQEDIEVLQILADQVSIAIENSNLFAESALAVEASRRAYGELSRQAWMVLLQGRPAFGYRTDSRGNIQAVEGGWSEELAEVQKAGQSIKLDAKTLAIPFKILDMPAGVIKLKKHADAREWSEREINLIESLVGNLGEALESARLYEDTQRRAERERITADIASRIRESLDVDTVLQTAALEMRRALNLEEITIRLGESDGQ
jgi:GAF domain-containing protein